MIALPIQKTAVAPQYWVEQEHEESQSDTVLAILRRAVTFADRAGRLLEVAFAGELGFCSGVSSIMSGLEGEGVDTGWRPAPNGK